MEKCEKVKSFLVTVNIIVILISLGNVRGSIEVEEIVSIHGENHEYLSYFNQSLNEYDEKKFGNGSLIKLFGSTSVQHIVRTILPALSIQTSVYAPDADEAFSCKEGQNCSTLYNTTLPLKCVNDSCECPPSLCWTYTYHREGIFSTFVYTCGECGQLGSECYSGSYLDNCNEPGFCARDGYCHCIEGEHDEDICIVEGGHAFLEFLVAGLVMFLLLTLTIVLYQMFLSYSHHRTVFWCRRVWRRRQRSRYAERSAKSPAYTAQQRMMQNFHLEYITEDPEHSDTSSQQSESPLPKLKELNVAEIESYGQISTSMRTNFNLTNSLGRATMKGSNKPSTTIHLKDLERESFAEKPLKKTISSSSLFTIDSSGMTDYFNQQNKKTDCNSNS